LFPVRNRLWARPGQLRFVNTYSIWFGDEGPEVDCRRFRELIADATPNAVEEITWDSGWAQSLAKEILGVPVFDY
jgi:hypothetical protein